MNENDLKTEPTGLNGSFDAQGIAVGVNSQRGSNRNIPKYSLRKRDEFTGSNPSIPQIRNPLDKEEMKTDHVTTDSAGNRTHWFTNRGKNTSSTDRQHSSAANPTAETPDTAATGPEDVEADVLSLKKLGGLTKKILRQNFWAAVSLALASFPLTLSFTLAINERIPNQAITYSSSILSLIWGSLSVAIYSSGKMMFRAFTGLLFPLVANSTERYGDEGLAGVVLCTSIIMTVGVLFNGFRYIRFIPTCVLEGIKNGTGYLIILTEMYSLTGVKQKHTSVTLYHFLGDVFTKFDKIHHGEFLLGVSIGFAGYKLHKKYKQVPWPFFIFGVGVLFGLFSYSAENHSRLSLLKDLAPLEFKKHGLLEGINLNFFAAGLKGLLIPGVYMYSLAVVMLTLFEVCISISLDEDTFGKKIKRKREFLSLSMANYISWAFGWFPLSNPVGRIQFALNCGANHRIFHFMNVGLMLFLYLFCFELTGYMPICLMKATNIMISLNLVEPWVIRTYAHYSPKTAVGMWAMVAAMLLVDVAICIPLFLVVFYAILWYYVKKEDVEFVEHGTDTLRIVLRGRLAFTNTGKITEKAAASKRDKVILDFSKCIATEVNFLRNYREVVVLLQTTYKAWFKIEGLEPKLLREAIESGALDASQVGFPAEPEAAQPSSGTPQSGTSHTAIKQPATKGKNAVVGKIPYLRRYLRA